MLLLPPPRMPGSWYVPRIPARPLVHVKQDILVVTQVVAVGDGVTELLLCKILGGLPADELTQLSERFRQVDVDPATLHVAAHHRLVVEGRGHVPPVRCARVCAAYEDSSGRWQRLATQRLPPRLSGAGADVCTVGVVDEARLVDARVGRCDLRVRACSGGCRAR